MAASPLETDQAAALQQQASIEGRTAVSQHSGLVASECLLGSILGVRFPQV